MEYGEKSQFNMAIASLERFNNILIEAYRCYNKGNMYGWFFTLKGLKMQIIYKIKPDERNILINIEKNIQDNSKVKDIINDNKISEENKIKIINNIIAPLIESYNEKIQDIMNDRGLLLPDKIDDSIFA